MTKIIVDCDPGHDDALALMLAKGHPAVELVGISLTHGNTSLDNVGQNALAVAELLRLDDIPIVAGAARPLAQERLAEVGIHGKTGLDGPPLPETDLTLDAGHAVDFLVTHLMDSAPSEITLVATGPLTNVALAVRREPRVVERVKELVLMGGSMGVGNRTPVAEFNVLSDPEAAHIVFGEEWDITMVGLDITHQVLATPERIRRLRGYGHRVGTFAADLVEYVAETYSRYPGAEGVFASPPVHDLCAVALVIDPAAFEVTKVPISVELEGSTTRGMTVPDWRAPAPEGCHTAAAVTVDAERVWELLFTGMENL